MLARPKAYFPKRDPAMHVEILVEERSAAVALSELLPKIIGQKATWMVHDHQGKKDLLKKLPERLRGYSRWLPSDCVIVVLIDADQQDCRALKAKLAADAEITGLRVSANSRSGGKRQVINRIAVEELEAWFLGDVDALRAAFPRIPPTIANQAKYRNPDAIKGGTWEALERVLQRAGYADAGLAKIATARTIAQYMEPHRNRSKSFQVFRDALEQVVAGQPIGKRRPH